MPEIHLNRTKKVLPVLTWLGIFLMPLLVAMLEGEQKPLDWYIGNLLLCLSIFIVYYVDYYLLIERYIIRRGKLWQFVVSNAVMSLLLSIADYMLVGRLLNDKMENPYELASNGIYFMLTAIVLMMLAASLSVAIRMTENTYNSNIKLSKAKKLQAEAELTNLKNQLNPHFLFNTLNNIYALAAIDNERARSSIHDLSHLLRYVIYDTSSIKVPLQGEMRFLADYVRIERLRLGENFDLKMELPEDCGDVEVPPLLFLPLVENAFKHGVSFSKPSFIHVVVKLENQTLSCEVTNSDHSRHQNDTGVGIQNTTKRLNMLYPGRYTLLQGNTGDGVYQTVLTINIA